MSTLISANADILWAKSFPRDRLFQIMSNGHYVVIFKDTGSGNLFYSTSPDSGATWTAGVVLPGSPTSDNLNSISVVSDVLHLWYSGSLLQLYTSPYNTSTNLFGAQTVHTYTLPIITYHDLVDADWDGDAWNVVAVVTIAGRKTIVVFRTPGFDGTLDTTQQFVNLQYAHTGINVIRIIAISGKLLVTWYDPNRKQMFLAPITLSAGAYHYTTASLETAFDLDDVDASFDIVQEGSGAQTLVVNNNGLLYSVQRTGTNTWGRLIPLQGQIISASAPSLLLDGVDLYIGFETEINQPNGETYIVKRTGSRWTLPIVVAGGASTGFKYPIIGLNAALYEDTSNNLYFIPWTRSSAPNAPTSLAPSGYVNSLTPHLSWKSNPSSPTDPTKSHQVKVVRVSDSHSMVDSGEIFDANQFYDVLIGAGLAYNVAYKFQVREKDSLSSLGAGAWGPYSTYCIFTPVRGGTPVITHVTSGGVTFSSFPASIGGTDIQVDGSYSQPDSDPTNAYQLVLYDTDDTTILALTPAQTLGPPIVSGGSFSTIDWTSGVLVNGHVYHLALRTFDATTGVMSESAHVQLTTSYSVPAGPTGLTATVNNDEGYVQLNWIEATSVIVEWRPYTETGKALEWITLASGEVWNQARIPLQAPQTISDYRVTIVNNVGIKSVPSTVSGVFLDNALDYAAIWINDITDPLNKKIYAGQVDNWDALKRDKVFDAQEWVPKGAKLPIISFGLTDYWIIGTSQGLKLFFPAAELDGSGNPRYGADNRDAAINMATSHNFLLYRDRRMPVPLFVKMWQYEDQPNMDVNTDLTLELHQAGFFGPLPIVGAVV